MTVATFGLWWIARLQRTHAAARIALPQQQKQQQWDTLFPRGIPLSVSHKQSTLYLFNLHSHNLDYLFNSEAFFYLDQIKNVVQCVYSRWNFMSAERLQKWEQFSRNNLILLSRCLQNPDP